MNVTFAWHHLDPGCCGEILCKMWAQQSLLSSLIQFCLFPFPDRTLRQEQAVSKLSEHGSYPCSHPLLGWSAVVHPARLAGYFKMMYSLLIVSRSAVLSSKHHTSFSNAANPINNSKIPPYSKAGTYFFSFFQKHNIRIK